MRLPCPRVQNRGTKMYASLMRQSLLSLLPMDALGGCRCKGACQTSRCACKGKGKFCGPKCSCYRRRAGSKQCLNRDTTRSGIKCDCKTACMSWRCPCKREEKECDSGCNCGTRRKRCKNRAISMLEDDDSKPMFVLPDLSGVAGAEEEEEEDDDQYTSADTYAHYMPSKLKIGCKHPDPVVESSSLSSVDPPEVWFDLKLPQSLIKQGKLSSLQLEAVVYACQQHTNILPDGTRAGFLIGDGAGVGKGRTVAGIIYQNYLEGRKKALWMSVSNDLKYDAERDLNDIGAKNIEVHALRKFRYGSISGKANGGVDEGVIFSTYSALIGKSMNGGKFNTRLSQLEDWLGSDFAGVIVFDECHKAKNLVCTKGKSSKTGQAVLRLQQLLPKARIVYCSATGASEPHNMAYMSRLGIWGQGTHFAGFEDFLKAMERRGVGAMEIVAIDMKLRGMYVARQLSFSGTTFQIENVSLSDKFTVGYDKAVEFWVLAKKNFLEAAELMDYKGRAMMYMWAHFWASHQRFFKYLCIAAKVPMTIDVTKKAIDEGKCVVIGLQSTGEARTMDQLEKAGGELNDFVSTAKGVLESLVDHQFPRPSCVEFTWEAFGTSRRQRSSRKKKTDSDDEEDEFDELEDEEEMEKEMEEETDEEEMDIESEPRSDEDDYDDTEDNDEETDEEEDGDKSDLDETEKENDDAWLPAEFHSSSMPKRRMNRKRKKDDDALVELGAMSKRLNRHLSDSDEQKPIKCEPEEDIKPLIHMKKEPRKSKRAVKVKNEHIDTKPKIRPKRETKPSLKAKSERDMSSDDDDIISGPSFMDMSTANLSPKDLKVIKLKKELVEKIMELSPYLPNNSLDELVDGLGGKSQVAEMTGRKGRVVSDEDGSIQYESRSEADVPLDMLNIQEKVRFMNGEKNVAIISEAASSGISLQADRRAKNRKRRVHITLELPWSADRAIQQFGRTHRSNQVSAPEYIFLISALSGEQRFASTVAKRLESLGALTHGDRRATESRDLSKYNLDTKYGRQALLVVLKSMIGQERPMARSEKYNRDFFINAREAMINADLLKFKKTLSRQVVLEKDSLINMPRFLNRLLGLPVELQNTVFSYFADTLHAIIVIAKRCGKYDGGIMDFGASGEHVELTESQEFECDPTLGPANRTELHKILIERGISYADALAKLNTDKQPEDGFYIAKKLRNDKKAVIMVKLTRAGSTFCVVHRPHTGVQGRFEAIAYIHKSYDKCTLEEAERWWNQQYEASVSTCVHKYWNGFCKNTSVRYKCEWGIRRKTYHLLTGSILSVWSQLERVFDTRLQIFRVRLPTRRLVGILIPPSCVPELKYALREIAERAARVAAAAKDAKPKPAIPIFAIKKQQ